MKSLMQRILEGDDILKSLDVDGYSDEDIDSSEESVNESAFRELADSLSTKQWELLAKFVGATKAPVNDYEKRMLLNSLKCT